MRSISTISTRHARYRKTQFEDIRHKLRAALCEEPPPCLLAAASRFGYAPRYLRRQFPKICQAIVNRCAQFRKKRSLERKKHATTTIRRLAVDLHAKGTYPTVRQLRKASNGPTGLEPSELCALLRDVKRELGLPKSD